MVPRALLGSFEQMVLAGILQVGERAYPPPVLAWIEERSGRPVNRGSFYVTLDRLERKRLLRSRPMNDDGARRGRPKRHLEVTPQGITALREVRNQLLESWNGLEHLLGDKT